MMTTTTASYTHPAYPISRYRFHLSGHSHRAKLFLSLLGLPYELIDVDLRAKAHKTEAFLKLNCFGQVPVIDDNGVIVADANAILTYLAGKYDDGHWLPRDPIGVAAVQRWLSVAAGLVAFGPAAARLIGDVACYSYIAHAPEGNVSLEPYPVLRAWLARIEALPGFVPMAASKAGLAAA
jgi:glutathione S-transferase